MRKLLLFVAVLLCLTGIASAQTVYAPEKFIPSYRQWQNPSVCPLSAAEAQSLAKYDLLVPTNALYDKCKPASYTGTLWSYMKIYNPDQLVFHYQNGPGQYSISAPLVLNPNGWTWVQANHGIAASDPNRWTAKGTGIPLDGTPSNYLVGGPLFCGGTDPCDNYGHTAVMRLANTNWQQYWIDNAFNLNGRANNTYGGTIDTTGLCCVFADNTNYAVPPSYREGFTGQPNYRDTPSASDYTGAWVSQNPDFHAASLAFADNAANQLGSAGHLFIMNWTGYDNPTWWSELDGRTHPPFAGMAEGTGGNISGHPFSDPTFMPAVFDVMKGITHTHSLFDNELPAACDDLSATYPGFTGMTCGELLWYEMGVFLMGFDTEIHNAFFGWTNSVTYTTVFPDELSGTSLHLGHQIGNYSTVQAGVYARQFDDGYYIINTNTTTVSGVGTPGGGTFVVCNHSNYTNADGRCGSSGVTSYTLTRNVGVILLRAGKYIDSRDNAAGAPALAITTQTPMPSGTVGTGYSQTLTATGGTAPYTCSIVSGSLPTSVTRTGCVLSGTPSAAGTFSFTARVTDNVSATNDKALQITIAAAQTTSGQVTSDTFTNSSTACLNSYSANWILVQDGGSTNCIKVDAATDVAYPATVDYAGLIARRAEAHGDDQGADLKITTMPADSSEGTQFVGLGVRISSTSTTRNACLVVVYKAGTTQYTAVGQITSGSFQTLDYTTGITWAVNDILRMDVAGTTVTVQQNGTTVHFTSTISCSLTGGTPGLVMSGAALTPAIDNFHSYTLVASGTIYVSTGGNDSNDCLSTTTACLTVHHGLSLLSAAGTMVLCDDSCNGLSGAGGSYATAIDDGTDNVPSGSDASHRTIIKAYPGESPVLALPTPGSGACGVRLTTADYIEISGTITIDATNVASCSTPDTVTEDTHGTQKLVDDGESDPDFNLTIAGSNRLLLFFSGNNCGTSCSADTLVAAPKWNASNTGVTHVSTGHVDNSTFGLNLQTYYLVAPTTGTHAAKWDFSGGTDYGGVVALSVTNVNQMSPVRTSGYVVNNGAGATSATNAVTGTVAGDLVICSLSIPRASASDPAATITGTGQTLIVGGAGLADSGGFHWFYVTKQTATGTTTTASWTFSSSAFQSECVDLQPTSTSSTAHAIAIASGSTGILLDGITVEHATVDCINVAGASFTGNLLTVDTCGMNGVTLTGTSPILEYSFITSATTSGIAVQVSSAEIIGNDVTANGYGVVTTGSISNIHVYNNAIYDNTTDGLDIKANSPTAALVYQNTFYSNGGKNADISGGSGHLYKNNISVSGGTGDTLTAATATTNSTSATFVSAPSDLHLAVGLPGTDLSGSLTTDKDGNTRVLFDRGAYEFLGLPAVTDVSPPSIPRAHAATVLISGANLDGSTPSITLSGSGISVSSISQLSATQMTATFTVASGATPSCQTVTVTTAIGAGVTGGTFCASSPIYLQRIGN